MRILVALGGNALQRAGGDGSWSQAVERMRATAPSLASLVQDGHELIVTHGNGPQIGALLRQNELGSREIPPRPLYVLGAESEGQIGFLIQQELSAALERAKSPRLVVTLVSRFEVSPRDPSFRKPTKPVGGYYSETDARLLRKNEGWELQYDGARGGWRRLVPSPKPLRWIEGEAVAQMYRSGWGSRWVPVVAGGGGVPVVPSGGGGFEGVDAVIDKDLSAALVGNQLSAEALLILTDVPGVAVGFGKPWERWLGRVTVAELEEFHRRGEFGEGSMAPKVVAGLHFLKGGGRQFLITDLASVGRAVRGEAGTRVLRD